MNDGKKKYNPLLLLLLLLLLLGGGIFAAGILAKQFNLINLDSLFCDKSRFSYINKELACGGSFIVKKHGYADFKSDLLKFIESKVKEKDVSEVSVYFRDLENGPTLGIGEHTVFVPASLLKVPLLITYLTIAEGQPEFLQKKLKYHKLKELPFSQKIAPTRSIEENASYTIDELLKYTISYSDNEAYFILVQYLIQVYPNEDLIGDTLTNLGIINPNDPWSETITVKSYASIFTQLYLSSFFERKETSEKTLSLLASTDYNNGLVAGVPSNIKIAHKFGERISTTDEKVPKQLHDCGIIYYPKNPYLLCVMTRGYDFDKLPGIISQISKMFYEEFDSRRL